MPDLAHFNQQVLLCQDDAYTLAWYLLGSDAQAEAATQAAVLAAYYQAAHAGDCRIVLLRQVVRQCQRENKNSTATSNPRLGQAFAALQQLPESERQALVLVDILGLSCPQAAAVLGCPPGAIRQRLAQGRRKI